MDTEEKSKKRPPDDNIKNVESEYFIPDKEFVYINPFDIFTLEELQSISDFEPDFEQAEEPKTKKPPLQKNPWIKNLLSSWMTLLNISSCTNRPPSVLRSSKYHFKPRRICSPHIGTQLNSMTNSRKTTNRYSSK